jgi:haloalkane dehalogenase
MASTAAVRRAYADLPGGGQIHYRLALDAPLGSPSLVLLHQVSSNSGMFRQVMAALAPRYRMIAPDLPGFGGSDLLPVTPSIEGYADAIQALVGGHLAIPGVVIGHHTGALVAIELARRDPASVALLILMGFPYYLSADERAARLHRIAPKPVTPEANGRHLLDEWSRLRALDDDAELDVVQDELVDTLLAPRYDLGYGAAFHYDIGAALADVRVPIAALSGSRDHLHPLQVRMSADLGIPLEVVPTGGVFMARQLPLDVASGIERILEATTPSPG